MASAVDTSAPAERGTLTIANTVGEKIIRRAVLAVPGTVAVSSTLGKSYPAVSVTIARAAPAIEVEVAVRWPANVGAVCRAIHDQVFADFAAYLGRSPSRVDVSVAKVVTDD